MAYQSIGRGSAANDGTGDDLRTGAGKVNDNFVEVYTYLGDGSTLSSDAVVTETATQTLTNKTITGTFTGNITGDVTGDVTGNVTGNITGDVTGDLTGNVTGDLTGDVTGGVTGDVTGNLTGNISSSSGNIVVTPATNILEVQGDGASVVGQLQLNCHVNTHGQIVASQPHSENATNTLTLPGGDTLGNADATLVSDTATQTLTNKTLTSPTITGTGAIAGTFTGNITGNVTGDVDGIVGGNTPAAGSFTTLSSSTHFQAAVYADTSARDAAITSPAAGMVAYLTATNKLQVYTGSAWETITSA